MKPLFVSLLLAVASSAASAKLPDPVLDDAAKAKAEEAKAKTAWQAKVDAFQLCKSQDRVAEHYRKSGKAPASAQPGTPCPDPGPFAFTPPEQKPLEASGAHSPAGTATSPPSTQQPASPTGPEKNEKKS